MQLNVQYTLVPDSYPNLPLNALPYPSEAPPHITNSICCAQFLDSMTTRQRYIMVVKTLIGEARDPHALTHVHHMHDRLLACFVQILQTGWQEVNIHVTRGLLGPLPMRSYVMQGFYVNMDYHNIAPDAVIDNCTVCSPCLRCNQNCPWCLSL